MRARTAPATWCGAVANSPFDTYDMMEWAVRPMEMCIRFYIGETPKGKHRNATQFQRELEARTGGGFTRFSATGAWHGQHERVTVYEVVGDFAPTLAEDLAQRARVLFSQEAVLWIGQPVTFGLEGRNGEERPIVPQSGGT